MSETMVFSFKSMVGDILEVYETKVIIKHKGVLNFFAQGIKGDKTIFYQDITSVQFKKAGLLAGHIQFAIKGGNESRGGILAGASDENTITFEDKLNEEAEKIVEYINKKIEESRNSGSVVVNNSSADELKKFKELLDMGVITQEEFDVKKKQILGL